MRIVWLGIAACALALAQNAAPKFVVGTVSAIKAESAEIEVKPDRGDAVSLKLTTATQVLRVPPGEKDLKKAEPIQATEVAPGDRVLVNLGPGAFEARRVVVMSSSDIAKRNAADTADWTRRGVSGIVAAKTGNEITLRKRSFQGESKLTVTVSGQTSFRRYAPDSVKFADAKSSGLNEINVGDQLRARGEKSEDGLKVNATEVVFGTFVTKAGQIAAVNVEGKEITIKDMATAQPLVIRLTADSQLKKMPDFAGMMGAGAAGGQQVGGPPMAGRAPGAPGGGPDLSQMLEHMPPAKLEDLKPGDTVVVSSTKGASSGQVTAIMMVANAGMLVRMASVQPGAGGAPGAGSRPGAGMGGMGMGGMGAGGLEGLQLPGMMP